MAKPGSKRAVSPAEEKLKEKLKAVRRLALAVRRLALLLRNWRGLIGALKATTLGGPGLASFETACKDWEVLAIAEIASVPTRARSAATHVAGLRDVRNNALAAAQGVLSTFIRPGDLKNLPDEVLAGLIQFEYLREDAFQELFIHRWQGKRCSMASTSMGLGPLCLFYKKHIHAVAALDAEDVLQELYVKLADGGLDSYDPGKPFKPWFWAVAYRHMMDQIRREKLRFTVPITGYGPLAPGLDPGDQAILKEEHQRFLAALSTLPTDQKEIIEWRMSGMSWEEIGDKKGIRKTDPDYKTKMNNEVRQPYHRGMRTLKKTLA